MDQKDDRTSFKSIIQRAIKSYSVVSCILMLIVSFRYIYEEYTGVQLKTFILLDIPLRYQEVLFYLFLFNCLILLPMFGLYFIVKQKNKEFGFLLISVSIVYAIISYIALREF